jgi:hypothetical protein
MPPVPHSPAARAEDHATLIVALDAGDLAGAELRTAESLAASCSGCAALVEDLAAIRGAMTALPTAPRRRDYRLTEADAVRLRPSGWRRLLEWLAAPGSTVRPLATALATLGVVGLLLTSEASGLLSGFGAGGAAPAMAPEASPFVGAAPGASSDTKLQDTYGPAAAPSGAPGEAPLLTATAAPAPMPTSAPAPGPTAGPAAAATAAPSDDGAGVAGAAAPAEPPVEREGATGASESAPDLGKAAGPDAGPTVPLPALVSLALLAAGLALLAGRIVARRRLS